MQADDRMQVEAGDLFTVVPFGQPHKPTLTLAAMLSFGDGWHAGTGPP